jgi:Ca2+-binding EF-hand superfamily protein
MNKKMILSLAAAAAVAGGLAAYAAEASEGHGRHHGHLFERMDSDGNGAISLTEAQEVAKKRFQRMDANGDGVITEADFLAMAGERFQKMDANGDGQVTKEEAQEGRKAWREEMRKKLEEN